MGKCITCGNEYSRTFDVKYDGRTMTFDCIDSLLATEWPSDRLEIVVVDNGSLDDVAERLRDGYPQVRLIVLLENRGFAGGCNTGMALAGDHDMVALINNDATVTPGWLAPMVASLEAFVLSDYNRQRDEQMAPVDLDRQEATQRVAELQAKANELRSRMRSASGLGGSCPLSKAMSSTPGTKPPTLRAQLRVVSKRGAKPGAPQPAHMARATCISCA